MERRELILAAATAVFGERGYAGATTAQVAKAADISQPYVVRMFGTKENLFLEAMDRALGKLLNAFRTLISEYDAGRMDSQVAALDPSLGETRAGHLRGLMGRAYADLIRDRGILLLLMQSFVSGHEPIIGPRARDAFLALFRLVRDEAGLGPQGASDFLAQGMLMNTLISLRMPEVFETNPLAGELLACTMKTKLDTVLAASQAHPRID
ncbi:hypothetical protein GCM10023166_32560 [Paeniglutamicibacter cryotolerans]|uniref:TetR/AcrR family transcriptional regulator n=1 Tax=Paeniglutamicibacter cryotolerans TaxID=670079 RepID=UPI001619BB9E|nr:helix-turn-helix domain-containing protein [Paeniglutamicibacter cryotolerans]